MGHNYSNDNEDYGYSGGQQPGYDDYSYNTPQYSQPGESYDPSDGAYPPYYYNTPQYSSPYDQQYGGNNTYYPDHANDAENYGDDAVSDPVSHTKYVIAGTGIAVAVIGALILSFAILSNKGGLETDDSSSGGLRADRTLATSAVVMEQDVTVEDSDEHSETETTALTSVSETETETTTTKATTTAIDYNATVTPDSKEYLKTMYINHKYPTLRIRSGPDQKYKSVYDGIPAGKAVDVYAEFYNEKEKQKWAYVTYDGHTGWSAESCMSDGPTEVYPAQTNLAGTMYADVDDEGLTLRYGPGFNYEKIDTIKSKGAVEVYAEFYDSSSGEIWAYVCYNKKYGWVCKKYLVSKLPETTTKKTTTSEKKTEPPTQTVTEPPVTETETETQTESTWVPNSVVMANFDKADCTVSYADYLCDNVVDNDLYTCWKMPWSEGTTAELKIYGSSPQEINTIYIFNGDITNSNELHISLCELVFSDGTSIKTTLSKGQNTIKLPKPITTDSVSIIVKSVDESDSGFVYSDLSIAEFCATYE